MSGKRRPRAKSEHRCTVHDKDLCRIISMRPPKRRPKRNLRECWVWWHTDVIEPCARSNATNSEPIDQPIHSRMRDGEWVLMREVRRAR